jgi:hypothetical protein
MPETVPVRPPLAASLTNGEDRRDDEPLPDDALLPADAALTGRAALPIALPPHGGRVQRVQQHVTGLAEDVREWVELRIKLAQAEAETFVQKKVHTIVMRTIPLVVAGLAGLFLLITLALFLGWWLGHAAWGFLIVTLLLLTVAGVLMYRNRDTLENPLEGAHMDTEKEH